MTMRLFMTVRGCFRQRVAFEHIRDFVQEIPLQSTVSAFKLASMSSAANSILQHVCRNACVNDRAEKQSPEIPAKQSR